MRKLEDILTGHSPECGHKLGDGDCPVCIDVREGQGIYSPTAGQTPPQRKWTRLRNLMCWFGVHAGPMTAIGLTLSRRGNYAFLLKCKHCSTTVVEEMRFRKP